MLPSHLLTEEVVRVRPAASTADPIYGTTWDYGTAASRTVVTGWLQQDQRTETFADGRDVFSQRWLLMTNELDIDANDRIEWDDHPAGTVIFTVDGPAEPASTPRGTDHLEVTLRVMEG
jgi:hypothetical protein